MTAAEKYSQLSEAQKAEVDTHKKDRWTKHQEHMRKWWANLDPEQRAVQVAKMKASRRLGKKERPGHSRGEAHYRARLTEEIVRQIHASVLPAKETAAKFGVLETSVRDIWRGFSWKHLGLPVIERKDNRRKDPKDKVAPPRPLLTLEQKEEIKARPWEDTKELAARMGVHWMAVASHRQRLGRNKGFK